MSKGSINRKALAAALLAIIVMLVLLRVFNVGHVVSYDEAWNASTVIDVAAGHTGDVFYKNFMRHPPLYLGLGVLYTRLTDAGRVGVSQALEIMSLIFAAALAVVIFFCGRDWFGDLAGLSAAFIFAVMPAARVYDTLAKQESMALLFVMLFVLFFFREKYLLSGVFLGCAMLTKEIFVFALVAVFMFLLVARRYQQIKWFFASLGIGVVLSFWWYLFVSRSEGEFLRFFLGRSNISQNWRQPWHYFFRLFPSDVGWIVVTLSVAGVVFLALRVKSEGWPGRPYRSRAGVGETGQTWQMALLPLIWILFTYAFLSLSVGKSPWLVYPALPALAILGGWSVSEGYRLMGAKRNVGIAVVVALLAAALALSIPVGFASFLKHADPKYSSSLRYERVARYMNGRMPEDGRVMLRVNDFGPVLAFYLKSYRPESILVVDEKSLRDGSIREPRYTVFIFERYEDVKTVENQIRSVKPDFLVIRPGFKSADGTDIALALAGLARPVGFGGVWVFDGKQLNEALGRLEAR